MHIILGLIYIGLSFIPTNASAILNNTYTITATAGQGGKIIPNGDVRVILKNNQSFVISADIGFEIAGLIVDGKSIKPDQTYTFKNVSDYHTIKAVFQEKCKFTISAKGALNGTIDPLGKIDVLEFDSQSFSITPDDNYYIDHLIIDDKRIKPTSQYTFWNVTQHHEISASFAPIKTLVITATAGNGGEIIPSGIIKVPEHSEYTFNILPDTGYMIQDVRVDNRSIGTMRQYVFRDVIIDQTIEVMFEENRSVQGHVFDRDTQKGIKNSILEALRYSNHSVLGIAISDDTGMYTLTNIPPVKDLILRCNPPVDNALIHLSDQFELIGQSKYNIQYYSNKSSMEEANQLSVSDSHLSNIDFQLAAYDDIGFCGRVHDGIVGIKDVRVSAFSAKQRLTRFAMTDDNGAYTINYLMPSDDYIVSAELNDPDLTLYYHLSSGFIIGVDPSTSSALIPNFATSISPSSPYLQNIDLVVETGATISGHVYDFQGNPLSNVHVNAWSSVLKHGNSSLTDHMGEYVIRGLIEIDPKLVKNKGYIVEARALDYPYQAYSMVTDVKDATLVATGSIGIDFYLPSGFSISGIVETSSGKGLRNVSVMVYSSDADIQRETLTNNKGEYLISDLKPASDYQVAVFAPGYSVQFYNNQSSSLTANPVNILEQDADNINFIVDKGGIIQGSILFDSIIGKSPDVMVHIWSFSTQSGGDVEVASNGRFEMAGLDENVHDYIIMASAKNYPNIYYRDNGDDNPENDTVYDASLASGVSPSSEKEFMLSLIPGYNISGCIEGDNISLNTFDVQATSDQTDIIYHTLAKNEDDRLCYSFDGLSSGTYQIVINDPQYQVNTQTITLTDRNIDNIDFTISICQGSEISGYLYQLPEGEKITIEAWSLRLQKGKKVRIKGTGHPIAYRIKGLLPSSDYQVELTSAKYPSQIYGQQAELKQLSYVNLTQGNVSGIDFTIDSSVGSVVIEGTISFPQTAETGEKICVHAYSRKNQMNVNTTVILAEINPVPYSLMGLVRTDDIILSIWPESNYPHQFYDQQEKGKNATLIDTSDNIADIINFSLETGRYISGQTVDGSGKGLPDCKISAFSKATGSRAFVFSNDNGEFIISGLIPADDYILHSHSNKMGTFYYVDNNTLSVRNKDKAVFLNLTHQSLDNIQLTLAEGYAISGTVQDISGKLMKNIRVEAWSPTLETGNSTFTDKNGEFIIDELPQGLDYQVTARPDRKWSYQCQTKYFIKTGSPDIRFILAQLETFTLSGKVTNQSLSPVTDATVRLCLQAELSNCISGISDKTGAYVIQGVTGNSNYQLEIIPEPNSHLGILKQYPIEIQSDTTKNFKLSAGASISGWVFSKTGNQPIANAIVSILSPSTGFFHKTLTQKDGAFKITNAPNVTDFEIIASADGYIESSLVHQAGTSDIQLMLEIGGTISGIVSDVSTGKYIKGAVVEIYSVANHNIDHYGGIAVSNKDGFYALNHLKKTDASGRIITDYMITAYAPGYPAQVISGVMTGDVINLFLYADINEAISIMVSDDSGLLSDQSKVMISVYTDSGYYCRKWIDSLTGFYLMGLTSGEQYYLLFSAYENDQALISQWASLDATGVMSKEHAGIFEPGDNCNFTFQPNQKRSLKKVVNQNLGHVQHLRSTSHDYRLINNRIRTTDDSSTIVVSNDPTVSVSWDAPESGEENLSGYYADFNGEQNYVYSLFNTVEKPVVRTRKITSSNLEGDDVSYYFHVAPVDKEGRIGQTTSIAFRIDTVAPTNVTVVAPEFVNDRNIALLLGATGATDVYVSNINYEESGEWDSLSIEKNWKLSSGDGLKTIYTRFRDTAGNTTDTMAHTIYSQVIENSGPMISDRTFTLLKALTDGLYVGIVEATDADDDPLTFTFDSRTMVYGFGLGNDDGLLFVDQAKYFPQSQDAYDLTITVQDAMESSSATVRVNVAATNNPPTINDQSFSIDEHSPVSSPVGIIDAVDPDGDALSFSIINGNESDIFAISFDSGILTVLSEALLDYEQQAVIVLTVAASDTQLTQTAQITIQINNINDHAPTISPHHFSIFENPAPLAEIGQISVSDADGQTPVCSILSGNESNAMAIDSETCRLVVNVPSAFDYEAKPDGYQLKISASDGSLVNQADITIAIKNINDLAPIIEPQFFTVSENCQINTNLYTIIANDPDQLTSLTYQLLDTNASLPFALNPETGAIQLISMIDYEEQSAYSLTVQVCDGRYTSSAGLTIQVININDNAPVVIDQIFYIEETTANNTIIGHMGISDADNDPLICQILNHSDEFIIDSEQNLQLINNQTINTFEQGGILMLTISVSDSIFTEMAVIRLSITPVNDHPPVLNDHECDILENTVGDIASMPATDSDNDVLTYSINQGNEAGYFKIDSYNGQISTSSTAQLDYEIQSSYTLTINVSDGLYNDTAILVIHIQNINDTPPELKSLSVQTLEDNPITACVEWFDADMDELMLVIKQQGIYGLAVLTHDNCLSYTPANDSNGVDYLQLTVSDGLHVSEPQLITITIIEVNDPPEISQINDQTVSENTSVGPVSFIVTDIDTLADQLAIHVESSNSDLFPINDSHLLLTDHELMLTPVSYESGSAQITLTINDGEFQAQSSFTVIVTPVNQLPVISAISDQVMDEDTTISAISFTVSDMETLIDNIHVWIETDNQPLFPSDNIQLSFHNNGYWISLKPDQNQFGFANITIFANDGNDTTEKTFSVTVLPIEDLPVLIPPEDIIVHENAQSQSVPFTVYDIETPHYQMKLSAISNNDHLIPNSSITFSGISHEKHLNFSIAPGHFGSCQIQIMIADEAGNTLTHTQNITVLRGNTMTFNGKNDFVEILDHESLCIENTLTLEVWIMPYTIATARQVIINKININNHGFSMALISDNYVQIIAGNESQSITVISQSTIIDNQWTHLAASITPQEITIMINGEIDVVISHSIFVNLNQSSPVIIGGLSEMPTMNSFYGQLDDIRLWKAARSESQINSFKNQRLSGTESGLAGYWYFKDNMANDYCLLNNDHYNHGVIHKDAPEVSIIVDQQTLEDTPVEFIEFTVSDLQVESLDITVGSNNSRLIPENQLVLSGSGNNRYLSITPAPDQWGDCTISIWVSDTETITRRTFNLKVLAVNDPPEIIPINDQTVPENTTIGPLPLTISDLETNNDALILSVDISNPDLFPMEESHVLLSDGYLTLTPITNASGKAQITINVSDGELQTKTSFSVMVSSVFNPPENLITVEDNQLHSIPFYINDIETPPDQLIISAISNNIDLIPQEFVNITGTTSNKWLNFSIAPGNFGHSQIVMSLADTTGHTLTHTLEITVQRGHTISFNGNDHYIEIADHESLHIENMFTIEAWIKPSSIATIEQIIFNKMTSSHHGICLSLISNNYIQCIAGNESDYTIFSSQTRIPENQWTHIAVSITPEKMSMIINGEIDVVKTNTISVNLNQNSPISIAGKSDMLALSGFCGQIDDIRLWKGTRTDDQLMTHMNQRLTGTETNLIGYWHCKDNLPHDYCLMNNGHQNNGVIRKYAPVVSIISSYQTSEDIPFEPIGFNVYDYYTSPEFLEITVSSNNSTLIPDNNIMLNGTGNKRNLHITPAPNQWGNCTINLWVSNHENTMQRSFNVTVLSVNDPPVMSLVNDLTIQEDDINVAFSVNVEDVDSMDSLYFMARSLNQDLISQDQIHISSNGNQKTIFISPEPDQSGTAMIELIALDSFEPDAVTVTQSVTITVLPVNDIPTIHAPEAITIHEDTMSEAIAITVQDIETSPNNLHISLTVDHTDLIDTSGISLTSQSNFRKMTLSPKTDKFGTAIIHLVVSDSEGLTQSASIILNVIPVNDAPTILQISDITIDEDAAFEPLHLSITDKETPVSELMLKPWFESNSILNPDDIVISYTDNAYQLSIRSKEDIYGTSRICLTVSDAEGLTDSTCFTVTINPVNDPPVFYAIDDISVLEDHPIDPVVLSVYDKETSIDNLQLDIFLYSEILPESAVSVHFNTDLQAYELQFEFPPDTFGDSTVVAMVSDPEGQQMTTTFQIHLISVNDAPVIFDINDQLFNESAQAVAIPVTIRDVETPVEWIDVDVSFQNNDILTYQGFTVFYDKIFYFNFNCIHNVFGEEVVTILATDSEGLTASKSFKVIVLENNDAPYIHPIDDIVSNEDAIPEPVQLRINDIDDPIESLTVNISFSNNEMIAEYQITNQKIILTPHHNSYGQTIVNVEVSDPKGLTSGTNFTWTVLPQKDLPIIRDIDDVVILEDEVNHVIKFTAMHVDYNFDQLTFSLFSHDHDKIKPEKQLISNNVLTLIPELDQWGDVQLCLTVSDPDDLTAQTCFNVSIQPVNDIPVAYNNQNTMYEDLSAIIKLEAEDSDGDPLTFTIEAKPLYGTIQWIDYHAISYQPNPHYFGMDRFSFVASDGIAHSNPAWISITINPIPDSPTANAGMDITINESQVITLNAYQSFDPDNDIETYSWQQIEGVLIDISSSDNMAISLNIPDVVYDQDLVFELWITDSTGKKDKDQIIVHVIDISPPIPGFTAEPTQGTVPLEVHFTDTSVGKIDKWLWEFGDGYISREQNPVHLYSTDGEYSVILSIVNAYGAKTKEKVDYIYVKAAQLKSNFIAHQTSGVAPLTVTFTDKSQGEIQSVIWDFGDGTQSDARSPIHTYDMPGDYTVTLTVYDHDSMDRKEKTHFISVVDRKIQGTVVSSENPDICLENYLVSARINNTIYKVYSDSQGNYTITGLPASNHIKIGVSAPSGDDRFFSQFYNQKEVLTDADELSTESSDLTGINFYLIPKPIIQITGRIHDNYHGLPGQHIYVFSENIQWGTETTSDDMGYYTLTGLKPANDYLVYAWWDEHNTQVYYALTEDNIPGQDEPIFSVFNESMATKVCVNDQNLIHMDIIFTMQDNTISGKVTDNSGNGLANIWVHAWSETLETGNVAQTDINGNYTITGLIPVYQDEIEEKGYRVYIQSYEFPEFVMVPSTDIDFQIITTTWISGKVQSENSMPVANATIEAWSVSDMEHIVYQALTDMNGVYTLNNIPFQSDFIVQVSSSDYSTYYFENTKDIQAATYVDVRSGPINTIDFHLQASGEISGLIYIDRYEKKAPEGISVNAWSPSSGISYQVETDSNGNFEITGMDTSISDYYLMIHHPDYLPAFYAKDAFQTTAIQKEQATTIQANGQAYSMVLNSGLTVCGQITGNVDSSKTYRIVAQSENFGIYQTADIDMSITSCFCIDHLTPDNYEFSLYYGQQLIVGQTILVISHMNDLSIYTEPPSLGKISGTIKGLSENTWAQLRVWSESLQTEKNIKLAGTGNTIQYTVDNLPRSNDYLAVITSNSFPDIYYDQHFQPYGAQPIDISKTDQNSIHFELISNASSIYGMIRMPENDLASVKLTACSPSTGICFHEWVSVQGEATAYSLKNLQKARDYMVSASADGYITQYFDHTSEAAFAENLDLEANSSMHNIHFNLSKGITLSGKVDTDLSYQVLTIEAEDQETHQIIDAELSESGTYTLVGLQNEHSYILWVRHIDGSRWYYADSMTSMSEKDADVITPISDHSFDMSIQPLDSLTGQVKSTSGLPISGVWIQADDTFGKLSRGAYSSDDGSFFIPSLPKDIIFSITAFPELNSLYLLSTKSGIKPGATDITFILEKQSGAELYGTIRNLQTNPEPFAQISIIDNQSQMIQAKSDRNGQYVIKGLQWGQQYRVQVIPFSESEAAFWQSSIDITTDRQRLDIELQPGIQMTGLVRVKNSEQGIKQALLSVESQSTGYYANVKANEKGWFEFTGMPNASDYDIRIIANHYQHVFMSNQYPESYRIFELIPSGSVSGKVIDQQTGNGLSGAIVNIRSSSNGVERSVQTGALGQFTLRGLPESNDQNQTISDYVLTVIADHYPIKTIRQIQAGHQRTIILSQSASQVIQVRMQDQSAQKWIVDLFENEGSFVQTHLIDTNNWQDCKGLDSETLYQLRITDMNTSEQYWIGDNGLCVASRDQAISLSIPSQIDIKAPDVQSGKRKINRTGGQGENQLLNITEIKSTTHSVYTSKTLSVSSVPVIEMSWKKFSPDDISGYYVTFTNKESFEWNPSTASGYHPIPFNHLSSPELSGNNVKIYCHVAAVDKMGIIGPTAHAGPYVIDTVPPGNLYITAPLSSQARSIPIKLHATDAQEIFLSASGYEIGGIWQPYSQSLTYLLEDQPGKQMIYASFRDRARNVSRTNTSVTLDAQSNKAPIANDLLFTAIEDRTFTGILSGQDDDGDSILFRIHSLPHHATLTLVDEITGKFSYEPDADFYGIDSFTFTVNDGSIDSEPANCTLTVSNTNDPPVLFASEFSIANDKIYSGTLQASDVDQDLLTYRIYSRPSKGNIQLTHSQTGEFIYAPYQQSIGKDSFLFTATDGISNPQPVLVTIEITSPLSNDHWYSGWYPEGYIVDHESQPLENMRVTFYANTGMAYTVLTDHNGYFVLNTQKLPVDAYPMQVSGNNYSDITIPWPYDNPPQAFEMLSVNDSDTVLLKGTCKGELDSDMECVVSALCDSGPRTIKSVEGYYTLAVRQENLPVDLEFWAEGYDKVLVEGVQVGRDIFWEKKQTEKIKAIKNGEDGCFIGILSF